MRTKLIACEIFLREFCLLVSRSPATVDVEFLPKGLHDIGAERMLARMQERVDAAAGQGYGALLLGYGLCNNGLAGLAARDTQLVIPRSHDCIGIFLGDRRRYREYFDAHPGTYYRTSGWTERGSADGAGEETVMRRLGMYMQYEALVEKYGEENAKYIAETLGDGLAHYDRLTFIRMGLACDDRFEALARDEARQRAWTFDVLQGSLEIMRKLVDGQWDGDFLVVPPGAIARPTHDENVIGCGGVCARGVTGGRT
jgi:hypothetical protein